MNIKSIITDYLCHINYFVFHRPWNKLKVFIREFIADMKVELWHLWYNRACKKAKKRLEKIRSNKKNQKEYTRLTGKEPLNDYNKYTIDYKDWIEYYRGE